VSLPVFHASGEQLRTTDLVVVDGTEGRHASVVRRLRVGERVVLTDAEPDALAEATRAFAPRDVEASTIDLTSNAALSQLADRLAGGQGPVVITCFEVIEHLSDFVPVIEWLTAMAADGATVAISVPNDVFTAVKNPFHVTMWGSSTVAELRDLLPADHVVASQVALSGSVISSGRAVDLSERIAATTDAVPLQYLMGFGPEADRFAPNAVVMPTDVAAQRVWERQREVDNAYYRTEAGAVAALRERVAALEAELAVARSGQGIA